MNLCTKARQEILSPQTKSTRMILCDFLLCRGKTRVFLVWESSTKNWISMKIVEKNQFPSFFPKSNPNALSPIAEFSTALSSNLMLVEKTIASNCNDPKQKIEKP